ncbi:MAG: MBOAT family O-acyltransferase [Oscillospiraceae bacterium]
MVFSSLIFIFRFLPVVLIVYYIVPPKFRNIVLLIASLFFYSWGEVRYFPVMAAMIVVNYGCALLVGNAKTRGRKKLFLAIALIVSFGFLAVFKYLDFIIENINALTGASISPVGLSLPLGISFYTFQTAAYTIDVYRGTIKPEKNFISLAAFISMFPQLIAGPIVRYQDVEYDLKRARRIDLDKFELGIERFSIGLAKKVLMANSIGMLWDEVEDLGFSSVSSGLAWLGLIAFTLQIYFDFSGYSDMAIGLGHMLGFNFPENFDTPYSSRSITEFWRRWHMTLSGWFREYVYIPLGGNRKGRWRTFLNTFIVWALTGIWHGASWNFLLWGLYFFVLINIERAGLKKHVLDRSPVFSHIYSIFFIVFGWSLFAITDMSVLGAFISLLFSFKGAGEGITGGIYYLRNYAVVLILGCYFSTAFSKNLWGKLRNSKAVRTIIPILLIVLCTAYLVDSTYNPFLYFRF